jgi:DNA-3-methyladenine glycosylase I
MIEKFSGSVGVCVDGDGAGRIRGIERKGETNNGERDVKRLLADAGIVRHRGKIEATIANARGVRELREAGTPLQELVWSFAPAKYSTPQTTADWFAQTAESQALSKRLKAAGFRFVGPTTVWAAMQACGIVNDHLATCWVREEVERAR